MIPVYQTLTVNKDGVGNCFNACVASILELPIEKASSILPGQPGSWLHRWKRWLADHGYRLVYADVDMPPLGYSIATVYTDRRYPDNHPRRPGVLIAHSCIALDGRIVHDPYPQANQNRDIRYFIELVPMTDQERRLHSCAVAKESIALNRL